MALVVLQPPPLWIELACFGIDEKSLEKHKQIRDKLERLLKKQVDTLCGVEHFSGLAQDRSNPSV